MTFGQALIYSLLGMMVVFFALVLLMCSGWFFVRWQNEHDSDRRREKNRKVCLRLLIAAIVALAVFLALHFLFPVSV